jgi:hypothetical protein
MSSRPQHGQPDTAQISLIGRPRQWKIALSLAVVGALAAPFAFRTYKAHPTYSAWVPFTAQDKEKLAIFLRTDDCRFIDDWYDKPDCDYFKMSPLHFEGFKERIEDELKSGGIERGHADHSMYWMMNVGTAAATAVSLFGLVYLIPMLIRGVAFLARRYWRWLNA